MAQGTTKSTTPKKNDKQGRWWDAPKAAVARELSKWTDNIEISSWGRRWNNLVFYRYMTGRPTAPSSYNYAATSRPSSANVYKRTQFFAPRYNVLRQCSDALANRVYKDRPILKVCPVDGDFKARVKSKKLTRFIDGAFEKYRLWPVIEQCGEDCRIWGSSFVKIDASYDKKEISVTRVLLDEVCIDDNEVNAGEPKRLSLRVFVNRAEMMAIYGNNPEAVSAITSAPKSSNGFYFDGDLDCTDVIVLREAWALPIAGKPGRHVLTVGNFCFTDEKYSRDHFPLAKLLFKSMSTDWFGQGMAEMACGLQTVVDRTCAAIDENVRRAAWPRIGIATGSNVNEARLADTSNGIYYYTGTDVSFKFPESVAGDQREYLLDTIERIKQIFRLNDQIAQGQKPRYTSGRAIDSQNEIDDAAHIDLALHLEDFVKDIGYLLIEAAEICKPTVMLPGRRIQEINWSDVQLSRTSYDLKMLSVGRLSGSWADKMQTVADWYAEGQISRADKMRLEQVPDLDGYADLANASLDYIEMVLDRMIDDGDYEPAEPWIDLQAALSTTQSRYLREKTDKTPQDRLDLLLQFMAQLQELIDEAAPAPSPAPMAAPGAFGLTPPTGPAPAPNPLPFAPSSAPPSPVAPA